MDRLGFQLDSSHSHKDPYNYEGDEKADKEGDR